MRALTRGAHPHIVEVLVLRMKAANLRAFEVAARDAFVAEMMAHTRQYSPRHAAWMEESDLRDAVIVGTARAAEHGFIQRGTVRFFLEMMILLGWGFDTDPLFPWAHETLSRDGYRTPMDRAEALHVGVTAFLGQVGEERHAYTGEAFRQFAAAAQGHDGPSGRPMAEDAVLALRRSYPRRAAACGAAPLERLVAEAIHRCLQHGWREPRQILSTAVMMFVFGHRFDADPFLPWRKAGSTDVRELISPDVPEKWLAEAEIWFQREVESR